MSDMEGWMGVGSDGSDGKETGGEERGGREEGG